MDITTQNFQQEVINKSLELPVVIQFYAPWCGPCKILKPVLSKVHQTTKHNFELKFVNVKEAPGLAKQFDVFTVPDVRLFKDGKILASFYGTKPEYIIENWLDRNLSEPVIGAYTDLETQLSNNQLEQAKKSLLQLAQKENPDSDFIKLILALQNMGANNPEAMNWIQQMGTSGPLQNVVKRVRDLIDIEVDEKNPGTPTSSPYTIQPEDVNNKIAIENIDISLLENLLHLGINEVRKKHGAAPLSGNNILKQAAFEQNKYQIRTDTLTHFQDNPNKKSVKERVDTFGGGFYTVGENVQYKGFAIRTWSGGQREILTPTYIEAAGELIKNWVNSPGHFRNLKNPDFKFMGTSVGWNPENNALFATQVFGA